MSWISPWALFLGGIDSAIYNTKQRLKAPFRKVLRRKYAKIYNQEQVFQTFTKDSKDIVLAGRPYSNMYYGNGLFMLHLINEYKRKNKKVKVIMFGSREGLAHYFNVELGYTVTDIDGKDENYHEKLAASLDDFENVLTIDDDKSYSEEYRNKPTYVPMIVEEIKKRSNEKDVVYLVTNLFVYKEAEKAVLTLSDAEHVRLIHFDLDFPNYKLEENAINILFPHYEKKERYENIYGRLKEVYPNIPTKMFQKNYFPYFHFAYEYEGKKGLYFMEQIEKWDD